MRAVLLCFAVQSFLCWTFNSVSMPRGAVYIGLNIHIFFQSDVPSLGGVSQLDVPSCAGIGARVGQPAVWEVMLEVCSLPISLLTCFFVKAQVWSTHWRGDARGMHPSLHCFTTVYVLSYRIVSKSIVIQYIIHKYAV